MPSIVLHCPNCRQPYQMSPEQISKYAGRTITCRKCKQPFAFDAAMDAAAQAAGQAEPEEEALVAAADSGVQAETGADEGQGAYAVGAGYAAMPAAPATAPPLPPPRRPAAPAQPAPPYPPPAAPAPPPAYAPQAYAPPPGAPAGFPPAAPQDSAVGGIGDIFGFQRMALPAILPLVFWTGVLYCLYNGLRLLLGLVLVTGLHNVPNNTYGWRTEHYTKLSFDGLFDRLVSPAGAYVILDALFWFILGPLFWRGFCELILAASRLLASERK